MCAEVLDTDAKSNILLKSRKLVVTILKYVAPL
jgi:hypothetical protein